MNIPLSNRNAEEMWYLRSAGLIPSAAGPWYLMFKFTLTLSLSRVINFKFPLQPHQNYYIKQ